MSTTPGSKRGLSPTFVAILIILALGVAFALYLIFNAEHIKLTGFWSPCRIAFRGANNWVQATPVCASCLLLRQFPGAPDPGRWMLKGKS